MEEKIDKILLANFKDGDWQTARKQLLDLFFVSNQVCPKCGEDDYWEQKSCTCQQCGHTWE